MLTFACKLWRLPHSHPDFVPANDEGDLAAPGVDKAGPAAVHHDVLAISGAETNGGVVERLAGVLQNCWWSSASVKQGVEHKALECFWVTVLVMEVK